MSDGNDTVSDDDITKMAIGCTKRIADMPLGEADDGLAD
jgi:hypothetical protein